MSDGKYNKKNLVFGLDIGTRSIVGSVGYLEGNNHFNVVAHYSKEHDTRAMLDGQIHDISKVSDTILKVKKELEMQLEMPLKDVCIAAAGRVLETLTVHVDFEFNEDTHITSEHIYSLDSMGVEKAYDVIRENENDIKYYCVGYTVVKYYLNDYVISNLEGHKGRKISADILATFLPEEVVDGLYTSVENAGLNVANLTLEPIAAINIAIPQKFRLLNIALVDVGAGTSDISITKDGSIIAYGMIPRAGDEISESLVSAYLVDFNTAEKIKRDSVTKKQITFKDIMGLKQKISGEAAIKEYKETVSSITKEIADKIIELNGGKSVNAVFVVGGGGKAAGFVENLAEYLDIPKERVALRGAEVLTDINFVQDDVKKDPLLVTPIGICLSYYEHKNNFIFVNVNDERIKLYDNDKLTVIDAALQIGFPNEALFARRGQALEYTLNGQKRMVRGQAGEPAVIKINGEEANINSKIIKNDRITISESTVGKPADQLIKTLPEYKSTMEFIVNGQKIVCPRFVQVNGELKSGDYSIQNNDEIEVLNYYTLEQLLQFMDIRYEDKVIKVNNKTAFESDKVYENFSIDFEDDKTIEDEKISEDVDNNFKVDFKDNNITTEISGNDIHKQAVSVKSEIKTENAKNDTGQTNVISVTVNGTPVMLKNKPKYLFVNILDVYPFDTSVMRGEALIQKINGEKCDFASVIKDGDILELYWSN